MYSVASTSVALEIVSVLASRSQVQLARPTQVQLEGMIMLETEYLDEFMLGISEPLLNHNMLGAGWLVAEQLNVTVDSSSMVWLSGCSSRSGTSEYNNEN